MLASAICRRANGPEVLDMGLLKLEALSDAPLQSEPFEYLVLEQFIDEAAKDAILRDFPQMPDAGSFPLTEVAVGPALQGLVDALDGPQFRRVIEGKFDLDLSRKPTMLNPKTAISMAVATTGK